ncbi:ribonuclease P protein component [Ferrovibrio sp.]|uniref:ribonuclease P protein component n=1 Tax=Ferrovibrio sp. TaxID=1917215 RepID=UPI003D277549
MATGGLERLRRRADYLRVQGAERRSAQPGLLLQAAPAMDLPGPPEFQGIRIGFTASRKVGNAVLRNRARRRLKALARELLQVHAQPGHDYVLVARQATPERAYGDLRRDLEAALKRLKLWRAA